MKNREQITISPGLHGIVVLAKSKAVNEREWLLLIGDVKVDDIDGRIVIYRYVAKELGGLFNRASEIPVRWGAIEGFDFYKATDEEKKIILGILKDNNYKYVKVLNKIIER